MTLFRRLLAAAAPAGSPRTGISLAFLSRAFTWPGDRALSVASVLGRSHLPPHRLHIRV